MDSDEPPVRDPLAVAPGVRRDASPSTEGTASATSRALHRLAALGSVYLLVCAVSVIGRGFRALGDERAHQLFEFADNPVVGLCVGVLATVLIQSSTTTTAITVAAVGTGALTVGDAVPIVLGANVGTTVTSTFVALGFAGAPREFRRALAASSINDFYNLLALAIFFPLELALHPLERASGWLTDQVDGVVLPDPSQGNVVRLLTAPVIELVGSTVGRIGTDAVGAGLTVVAGIVLILVAVRLLSSLLKHVVVGRARAALMRAVGGRSVWGVLTGTGVTIATQSSTVTTSVLVPFAGTGTITPAQVYPVTVGANLGTTLTALLAAFAVTGPDAAFGLQAAFVHVLYNVFSLVVIFVLPVLRPVPLWCAEHLASVAARRRWVLAVYLLGVFVVTPLVVIALGLLDVL